ncbi:MULTISPECIES: phage tail tape measure protein [Bacillota]|uniref:phage tail tape measure protein n=1 Tax=Bacillota TaxID=1239 RepID=UPI0025704912|nr:MULTISPECIES: phage tail tape measure protein [Bacillota]
MAKGIKGITVEIGGDTGPLDKALSDVNKRSRSLQVELRQVERLLKFDPTNTELLAQKQTLLSKSVETTEEKLNALKTAQDQVQAQFEKGDIGEEQYRAFQREVAKTENELKNMKSSLEVATRNLNEFGDNNGVAKQEAEKLSKSIEETKRALESEKKALKEAEEAQKKHTKEVNDAKKELEDYKEKIIDKSKTVGKSLLAVDGAVLASAGYALKLSDDFDKAFNTLITKTGASKEEFDSLNTSMENVYKNNFGESIEDVAQSMAIVKINTNLAGAELEKATERALLLRDTFEFDVNESTRTAKMLMEQFGITSEEAYNLIAQGAQAGLDKNGDLLDTINEYSVHFKQLGIDSEEMFNMLVNGAESGTFSVDKLGDSVKEFGIRVKDGTAENAFKTLGFDVDEMTKKFGSGGESAKSALNDVTQALFNMEDPVKQNALGVELFGTMWEDLGVDGIKALMDMQWEIDKTNSALENINNQKYDNVGSALEGLGRTLKVDVVEPLGEELKPAVEEAITYVQDNAPTIKDIVSQIAKKIGEFVSFVVNNGPVILSLISGIGAAFVTWKVISTITGLVGAINAFKTANESATTAQAIFNGVLNMNPVGAVIMAITGLVAAFITLWTTSEDFRKFWIGLWETIKTFFINSWNAIVSFFTETIPSWFESLKTWFSDGWNSICQWTKEAWDNICNFVQVGILLIGEILSFAFEIITLPYRFIWENCKEIVIEVWDFIKQWLSDKWNEISSKLSEVFGPMIEFFSNTWNNIKEYASTKWNEIKDNLSSKWNEVKNNATEKFNQVKSTISDKWNEVKNNTLDKWNTIKSDLSTKWNNIKTDASTRFGTIKSAISDKWDEIKKNTSDKWDEIKNKVKDGIDKLKSFMNFKWELPKIKMPHFKISGKFSLNPVSVPSFGVEWFKNGGIMTKPTMFGINGNNAMVGGEAGPEAILPISNLRTYIREEMANFSIDYNQIAQAFIYAIEQTGIDNPVFNLDGKQVAKLTAKHTYSEIKTNNNRIARFRGE